MSPVETAQIIAALGAVPLDRHQRVQNLVDAYGHIGIQQLPDGRIIVDLGESSAATA